MPRNIAAAFCVTAFCVAASTLLPLTAAHADPFLIVPGQSIGRTHLGRNGSFYLKRLPAPTASDAAMMQDELVWQSPATGETLAIHTLNNGVLDPPKPGVTINVIRVTSHHFHTRSGLGPGSTLAQIRRQFPKGRLDNSDFYLANRSGVAFEFAHHPTAATRCIAVSVSLPGAGSAETTESEVRDILRSGN